MTEVRASQAAAWLAASRPKTLAVGVAPVLLGTTLAWRDGARQPLSAVLALAVALAMQIGTNLFNDWADGVRGTDDGDRLGPARAVASGWLAPRTVLVGAVAAFALAAAAGLGLAAQSGWQLVAVGAACILAGLAYTGGPAPLAYLGLGEPFVLLFFGLVATGGTYYVQARTLTEPTLLLGAGLGLAATAVLVVNNLRDRAGDARAAKRTLAVRFGARFARLEHALCLVGALFAVAAAAHVANQPWWLLGLATAPLALLEIRAVARRDGVDLNAQLAGAARFALLLAVATSAGILLGAPR